MNIIDICKPLESVCGISVIHHNVPMKNHTSMKVGGEAALMIEPSSIICLQKSISLLREMNVPYLVIGNGSNLIFSDEGYKGVIVKIGPKMSEIEVKDNTIMAMAGASLALVASRAMENSLTGLEFASGIPGSIGGGVCMNAGAYGGEMSQVVAESICVDQRGELITLRGREHDFSYRYSRIQKEGLVCAQVVLHLEKGDKEEIHAKMIDLNSRRRERQPLNFPSSGSVFKRPQGNFAGKLIQDCGLMGTKIGGAQVSDKHCGFIINTGDATASDVIELIKLVQETVYKNTGVSLELEVKIIGGTKYGTTDYNRNVGSR